MIIDETLYLICHNKFYGYHWFDDEIRDLSINDVDRIGAMARDAGFALDHPHVMGPHHPSIMRGIWWSREAEQVALAWTRTAPGAMLTRHYGLRDDALDGGF